MPAGHVDPNKQTTLVSNLEANVTADPEALQAVIEDHATQINANYDDVETHKAEDVTAGDTPHGLNYEEGVWTPAVRGSGTAGTNTYSQQVGIYTRINNFIYASCRVELSDFDDISSGNMWITGLPFSATSQTIQPVACQYRNIDLPTGATELVPIVQDNLILLQVQGSGLSTKSITNTEMKDNTQIRISAVYKI